MTCATRRLDTRLRRDRWVLIEQCGQLTRRRELCVPSETLDCTHGAGKERASIAFCLPCDQRLLIGRRLPPFAWPTARAAPQRSVRERLRSACAVFAAVIPRWRPRQHDGRVLQLRVRHREHPGTGGRAPPTPLVVLYTAVGHRAERAQGERLNA